jgi:hypothetical protein
MLNGVAHESKDGSYLKYDELEDSLTAFNDKAADDFIFYKCDKCDYGPCYSQNIDSNPCGEDHREFIVTSDLSVFINSSTIY